MGYLPAKEFTNIKQLQQFDPARTWLWDLKFAFLPFTNPGNKKFHSNLQGQIPTKLVSWIPADNLTRTIAIVQSSDITTGQSIYRFPSGSSTLDITINFLDDYQGNIKNWLEVWMNSVILCNGNGVNWVSECTDVLTLAEKLPDGGLARQNMIVVYPDGPLQDLWNSDSGFKAYSQNFVVCGKL